MHGATSDLIGENFPEMRPTRTTSAYATLRSTRLAILLYSTGIMMRLLRLLFSVTPDYIEGQITVHGLDTVLLPD